MKTTIGKEVIVRGDRSGVFFGTLKEQNGSIVELENARKLWYWDGAAAIEQLSVDGVSKPNNCKFTITVDLIEITDAIQIIPCTEKAINNIKGVKAWMF